MPDYPTPLVIFVSLLVGLVCVLRICVAFRTGATTIRGPGFSAPVWTREDNPIGFSVQIVLMAFVALTSFAVLLHTFGLAPDPILVIERAAEAIFHDLFPSPGSARSA